MVRLCSLAEPTGPAQVCRAYLHMASPGRGVFQHPARLYPFTVDSRKRSYRGESSSGAQEHPCPFRGHITARARDAQIQRECRASPHYARDAGARSWRWSRHRATTGARTSGVLFAVRRKVRDPRTPGRAAISAVAAGGSCIMRARGPDSPIGPLVDPPVL